MEREKEEKMVEEEDLKLTVECNAIDNAAKRRSIWKNVIVVSVAFMLIFSAFRTVTPLQSSINKESGLGSTSIAIFCLSMIVSAMFVPSCLIEKLGIKWTLVASMLCFLLFIIAQFYPRFFTLIPAAAIAGIGAAPMWTAKCSYITLLATQYSQLNGGSEEIQPILTKFFGVFFLLLQLSTVLGNLISSLVLSVGKDINANSTNLLSEDQIASTCGARYDPSAAVFNSSKEEEDKDENNNFSADVNLVNILTGIFLVFSLAAPTVIAFLLDPPSKFSAKESDSDNPAKLGECQLLVATFSHMRIPKQILIIPITFWSGVEQSFIAADFTSGYVSCAYGVENVGYVILTCAFFDAISSYFLGILSRNRIPIFLLGAALNLTCIFIFFLWVPKSRDRWMIFSLAALWGIADAVWQTQINALYGMLFADRKNAGFSNYRLWESLGGLFSYGIQPLIPMYIKLGIMTITLIMGMGGYLMVELLEWKRVRGSNI